ncbi:hypothetical protein Agub_g10351, partial [Astrephomene gubernaculifera]
MARFIAEDAGLWALPPSRSRQPRLEMPFQRERSMHLLLLYVHALAMGLSYACFAKFDCSGEGQFLPMTSNLLTRYPCNGSMLSRAAFILRHLPHAIYDTLQLTQSRWVSVAMALCLLRLPLVHLLPPEKYDVMGQVLTYTSRIIPMAWHVFVYGHTAEPSAHSVWFYTGFNPFLDLFLFFTTPVNPPHFLLEALTGLVNLAGIALLSYNSGRLHPQSGMSPMTVLPCQMLTFAACLALAWTGSSRRRRGAARRGGGGSSAGGVGQGAAGAQSPGEAGQAPKASSSSLAGGGSGGGKLLAAGCQPLSGKGAEHGEAEGCSALRHSGNIATDHVEAAAPVVPAASPSDLGHPGQLQLHLGRQHSHEEPPEPHACSSEETTRHQQGLGHVPLPPCPTAAAAAPQAPVRRLAPYRPFVKHHLLYAKIPGFEPTQITPGFE